MLSLKTSFTLIATLATTACVVTDTGVGGGPTTLSLGEGSPIIDGDRVRFNGGSSPISVFRSTGQGAGIQKDNNLANPGGYLTIIGQTGSIEGVAASVLAGDELTQGVSVSRTGETSLPSSGSATFTGPYAGTLVNITNQFHYKDHIVGTATVDVDLDNALVDVAITDRSQPSVIDAGSDITFSDLIANDLSLQNDATFEGSATGGGLRSGAFLRATPSNQTITGLLGGPEGEEVAGAVSVDHNFSTATLREQGFFLATDPQ